MKKAVKIWQHDEVDLILGFFIINLNSLQC